MASAYLQQSQPIFNFWAPKFFGFIMGLYLYFRQVIQAHRRGQMRWSWLQWWWQWCHRCQRCQRWWWWRWQWGHLSRQRTCIVDNRCDATREDEDDACADESHPKLPPSTFAVTFHLSEKYTFWRDECEDDGEWGRWLIQRFKVQLFHPKMTIYNRSNNSDCHNALQWPLGSWWLQWSFPICISVAAKYWWCYVANWCLLLLPLCKCQLCHSLRQWRSIRKVTENLFSVHTTGSQQSLQITRTWSRWSKPKFTF